jgi:hypothetical protein
MRPKLATLEGGILRIDVTGFGHGDRTVVVAAHAIAIDEIAASLEHHHQFPPLLV